MDSVPSASSFSLPLPSWQQPISVRVARYERKKRKKDLDDWGDGENDTEGETTDAASEGVPPGPSLTLSPDEAHQYRVAGLSFDEELPGGNFPHAPANEGPSTRQGRDETLKELSLMSLPMYPPQSAAHQGNIRVQHFAVLSSILHRCLLKRDYIRAGRAWGLILREEYRGIPLDVRTEGRWGIGAEILLRRDRQISDIASGAARDDEEIQRKDPSKIYFTRRGLEDAKQYYERLIIQHPFRKSAPDALSSLHFYPAMFGLWVYVTHEESRVSRQNIWNRHDEPSEASEDEDDASDFEGPHGSRKRTQVLIAEARKIELDEAQKIAARMDEILMSPPYSDSPDLLELRGMVSLWIGDLFMSSLPYPESDEYDEDNNAESTEDSIQMRREQRLAADKRQSEIQKSEEFFEKAKQRGKGVASTFEELHIGDDDDVTFG
ncbi:uncharacterized protein ATNIH1004_003282 [Aspergillus tanneri]|uniref:Transcription initiation factor Rrn11 n=1 Tax=Aspergillus tanneri TaxID=1220188 RepID=A0A5M9MU39_9EURO|nr:uncharacterized protein ATNIH1004_003282 [Aspergillus tanneri]KAA8650595.1 hypothetical protein ATNIH1004_003282 [Aspergillus tanneri]